MVVGTSPGSSFLMPNEDERTELQLEPDSLHTVVPVSCMVCFFRPNAVMIW